jgi:CubicO group peptidase (beta-lactamase class C family)
MAEKARFGRVDQVLQAQVEAGRVPGFVAAVRCEGETEVYAGGRLALDGGAPVEPDTLFRIASLTKPFAGALTLALAADGVLRLDDPVDGWLPELAGPRVIADPAGPLTDTVPAERSITVRDLLTNTAGLGFVLQLGPLQDAMAGRGVAPDPFGPHLPPDEFLARLGELPLAGRPGETWNYHTGSDVLSVLLARATGRTPGELLGQRVTGPLGLRDTAFWTSETARLAACYAPADTGLTLVEPPDGVFSRPRVFESLGGGLLSTAPELLAFLGALADGGGPVLPPAAVGEMTRGALTDALSDTQRAAGRDILGPARSWGLQVGVDVADREQPWRRTGRWGWDGGTGTSAWVDPARDLAAVLLTQRMMTGAHDEPVEFWRTVYGCL